MEIRQRALLGCAIAVTILLFACGMPQSAVVVSAGPAVSGVLNPAGVAPEGLESVGMYVLWQHDLGQIEGGKEIREVYLAGDNLLVEAGGTLFLFDAAKGFCKGAASLKGVLDQAPVMVGNSLYLMCGTWLLDVNPDSGEIRRDLAPRVAATCAPVPYPGSLLLGDATGRVVRFGLETGEHVWLASAEGAVTTPPVVDGKSVYVVGYKAKAVAMTGSEGKDLWTWSPAPPSQLTSGLMFADGRLYVGDNRGFVYCLLAEAGVPVWKYAAGGPVSLAPEFVRGKLLVFPYKSAALCMDPAGPTVLWEHPDAQRLLATGKKGLYLLTRDNCVAYVSLETGEEKWRRPLVKDCAVASDPSRDTFYIYLRSGPIMAIRELP